MSDSGVSTASNGCIGGIQDESQEKIHLDIPKRKDNDEWENFSSLHLSSARQYLSKSVINLTPSLYSSSSLSRSESTCSLASSIASGSSVTALDIRSLTNNYQKMLRQATKKIQKLNQDVLKLERDKEKLLETNVELALQTKKMLQEQKEWEKDEKELIRANDEFAAEVERLYHSEEELIKSKEVCEKKIEEMKAKFDKEAQLHLEEKTRLEVDLSRLSECLKETVAEKTVIKSEKEALEDEFSCSQEYIRSSFKSDILEYQRKVETLESKLVAEKKRREETDVKYWKLTQDKESIENELFILKAQYNDTLEQIEKKVLSLKDENEKLKSDNFECVVENGELKRQFQMKEENENKLVKDIKQLSVENQWLMNNPKSADINSSSLELEEAKSELKLEREKVKNLMSWKSQLADKNKKLLEENDRLANKADYLEGLVSDEVSDIDEILSVINKIQAEKKSSREITI